MTHDDLQRLERSLDAVAGRLAEQRPWDQLAPRVQWRLRVPFLHFFGWAVFTVGLAAAALRYEELWIAVAFLGLVVLPERLQRVLEHRRSFANASTNELLATYAADLRRVGARQLVRFLVDPLVILLLLILTQFSRWPLVPACLAAGLVVRLIVTATVTMPRTRRELVALGDEDEPLDAEEPLEDDDEPDEPWAKLLMGLFGAYVQVFLMYLAPLLAIFAAFVAVRSDEPMRPAVIAAVLALGAALTWWRAQGREGGPQ